MDETKEIRKALVPEMPTHLAMALLRGEKVWSTEDLTREFEVLGFAAPLVIVKRKTDSAYGSLKFTHNPRWYFEWQPE